MSIILRPTRENALNVLRLFIQKDRQAAAEPLKKERDELQDKINELHEKQRAIFDKAISGKFGDAQRVAKKIKRMASRLPGGSSIQHAHTTGTYIHERQIYGGGQPEFEYQVGVNLDVTRKVALGSKIVGQLKALQKKIDEFEGQKHIRNSRINAANRNITIDELAAQLPPEATAHIDAIRDMLKKAAEQKHQEQNS